MLVEDCLKGSESKAETESDNVLAVDKLKREVMNVDCTETVAAANDGTEDNEMNVNDCDSDEVSQFLKALSKVMLKDSESDVEITMWKGEHERLIESAEIAGLSMAKTENEPREATESLSDDDTCSIDCDEVMNADKKAEVDGNKLNEDEFEETMLLAEALLSELTSEKSEKMKVKESEDNESLKVKVIENELSKVEKHVNEDDTVIESMSEAETLELHQESKKLSAVEAEKLNECAEMSKEEEICECDSNRLSEVIVNENEESDEKLCKVQMNLTEVKTSLNEFDAKLMHVEDSLEETRERLLKLKKQLRVDFGLKAEVVSKGNDVSELDLEAEIEQEKSVNTVVEFEEKEGMFVSAETKEKMEEAAVVVKGVEADASFKIKEERTGGETETMLWKCWQQNEFENELKVGTDWDARLRHKVDLWVINAVDPMVE